MPSTYSSRQSIANILDRNIQNFFNSDEVELIPFGVEMFNNESLNDFIKLPISNKSHSSMIIKFAPDYILLKKTVPQQIFFIELKVSVTPLWASSRVNSIKNFHNIPQLKLSDVGIIAREAWASYYKYYPNTIIIAASTYNPELIKAQFVHNIKCLWCHDMVENMQANEYPNKFNCNNCPMKKNELFNYTRNANSSGSQTPQTNLDYSSFLPAVRFFESIGINVNNRVISECKEELKSHGVFFSNNIYENIKSRVIDTLRREGCDWL